MSLSTSAVWLYVASLSMLWDCHGARLTIAPTSTAAFFGARQYPCNYGVVFFAYGVGAIFANVISGTSKDVFGSYDAAFAVVATLALLGAVISITLPKPPQAE